MNKTTISITRLTKLAIFLIVISFIFNFSINLYHIVDSHSCICAIPIFPKNIGEALNIITSAIISAWIYRTNRNCHQGGVVGMRFSPFLSCLWSLIPLICFLFYFITLSSSMIWPSIFALSKIFDLSWNVIYISGFIFAFFIIQELWKTSKDPSNWKDEKNSSQITWWWCLGGISLLLKQVYTLATGIGDINHFILLWTVFLIKCTCDLIFILLEIKIMISINKMQEKELRRLEITVI